MFDLIHITASYSNAVLVAILPHVSDYAKKLDLPFQQPITLNQVAHAGIDNRKDMVGAGIWFTNDYWVSFNGGYVGGFRLNKNNPFIDSDPAANWKNYAFGKDAITTNQAIDMVRNSIVKLGYDTNVFDTSKSPNIFTGPYDLKDGNHVPYCEITWKNNPDSTNTFYIQGQVDMERNKLIALTAVSKVLNNTNPTVSVTPQMESDFKRSIMKPMGMNTNAPRMFTH